MVVGAKLEAVVGPAHQISLAAPVSVIQSPVPRAVTVPLPLVTRLLWSATSPAIKVSSGTSLTWNWN